MSRGIADIFLDGFSGMRLWARNGIFRFAGGGNPQLQQTGSKFLSSFLRVILAYPLQFVAPENVPGFFGLYGGYLLY
jgi:hypothetical protein